MKYLTLALISCIGAMMTPDITHTSNPASTKEDWGFFAHRQLNRLAVFTLPPEMIDFYKKNIGFLEEHAVDPDRRRYALRNEASRHYLDMDHWGEKPEHSFPRSYEEAIARYAHFYLIEGTDTTMLFDTLLPSDSKESHLNFSQDFKTKHTVYKQGLEVSTVADWLHRHAMKYQDPRAWTVPPEDSRTLDSSSLPENPALLIEDRFSPHGILPYSLPAFYNRLVAAFKKRDKERILKLSADLGHYVGDAHVPLHTTVNYNGQLTNQDGIHAFWESRIPELFAETEFDPVVGQARYVDHVSDYIWKVLKESHQMVDTVLAAEKKLSMMVPQDQQYCFESRLGVVTKLPCREYAARYHRLLDRQVELRFRDCILAIGSLWYSAWTDAGQPDLSRTEITTDGPYFTIVDSLKNGANAEIRPHE